MKGQSFKKSRYIAEALVLMAVYLMHLALLQGFVAGFHRSLHSHGAESFFSGSNHRQDDNSRVVIFRMLDKCEVAEQDLDLVSDHSIVYCLLPDILQPLVQTEVCSTLSRYPRLLSAASYRLYLRDRVFLI